MNATISRSHLFFLIIKTQIGIGLLSLPSKIQSTAKGDAWISVLIAGLAIQFILLVYWRLLVKFPNQTLRDITIRVLGRYLGKALNFIYFVFFIAIAGYASALYTQLIKTWMLSLTPSWVILLLIIGTSVYLALESLSIIARFFILTAILFIFLFLISLLNFTNDVQLSNILPLGQSGVKHILLGSEKTFFSMLGFEVVLFFSAYVQQTPKGLLRVYTITNCFVTLFYTYFVFLCLVGFSPKALEQVNEPVLFIFKGLTYQLFDRLDLIFLTVWIVPMTATIVSYLCIAGKSLTTTQSSYRIMVGSSGLLIFLLAWYLTTLENFDAFSKWLEYSYFIMITLIPIVLWLLSFLLKHTKKVGAI